MILTGKCLIAFWEWFLLPETLKRHKLSSMDRFNGSRPAVKLHFVAMAMPMQYGVFQDFFEQNRIFPDVINCDMPEPMKINGAEGQFHAIVQNESSYFPLIFCDDKDQARKESIIEANNLYNQK